MRRVDKQTLFVSLTLLLAGHLYELGYSLSAHSKTNSNGKDTAAVFIDDATEISRVTVPQTAGAKPSWLARKNLYLANKPETKLSFIDLLRNTESYGTLVDKVFSYDLGIPPP